MKYKYKGVDIMLDTSLYEIGLIGVIRKKLKKYEDNIYFLSIDGGEDVYELFDDEDVRRKLRIESILGDKIINEIKNNNTKCVDIIDVLIADENKYLTLLISENSAKLKYGKVSIDVALTDDKDFDFNKDFPNAKIYCTILDIFVGYSNDCI